VTSSRLFRALLVAVILITALALRIGYIESTPYHAINDAGTYNRLASMVARTGDYVTGNGPGSGAGGSRGPTAYFPPGFPYFLAAVDVLDGHQSGRRPAISGERIAMAVLGTATVGLIGLVGLEALGGAVSVIAMLLAAVYPVLIEESGTLVAENLVVVLILAAMWAGLRARRAARPYAWIAGTGVLTGLATLTHQNAALILIPFAFAAVGAAIGRGSGGTTGTRGSRGTTGTRGSRGTTGTRGSRGTTGTRGSRGTTGTRGSGGTIGGRGAARGAIGRSSRRTSIGAVALLVACAAAPILPWTIRNAVELHAFVPISTETGITLVGTYNREAANYAPVPYKWIFYIRLPEDQALFHNAGRYTEPALSNRLVSQTLSYIGAHPLAPLDVGWHNLRRMLELEGTAAWHDSARAIGLSLSTAKTGVIAFWIMSCLALFGAFTSSARRAPRWLWAVPVLLALSVLFVNVETPRFREPIEPFLVLLAACAVASALSRVTRSSRLTPARHTNPAQSAT
jgi:Dolichyl-phosphate-mannose-protein mannosyltransferase